MFLLWRCTEHGTKKPANNFEYIEHVQRPKSCSMSAHMFSNTAVQCYWTHVQLTEQVSISDTLNNNYKKIIIVAKPFTVIKQHLTHAARWFGNTNITLYEQAQVLCCQREQIIKKFSTCMLQRIQVFQSNNRGKVKKFFISTRKANTKNLTSLTLSEQTRF